MARYPVRQPEPPQAAEGGVTTVDHAPAILTVFQADDSDLAIWDLSDRCGLGC